MNKNIDYTVRREKAYKLVESGKYNTVIHMFYKDNVEWFIDDIVYNQDFDFDEKV